MGRRTIILLAVGAGLLLTLVSSAYVVREAEQAIVLRFGAVQRTVQEAGLHFRLPFIDQVIYLDRRVLAVDVQPQELILGDRRRLVVDSYARYRIVDPALFYQRVRTEAGLQAQIQPILNSSMRNVLGEVPLFTVLSADRDDLMGRIEERANVALGQYGIDVVDIRIKRADLPAENSQAIYRRMQTEREQEARELRAQGAELAQRIRARAERERTVLIAEAQRDSQILRGEGDGTAVRIFAEAFTQDASFFRFYRSMQAYREALGADTTQFVMSPESDFFRYFGDGSIAEMIAAAPPLPEPGVDEQASPEAALDPTTTPGDDDSETTDAGALEAAGEPAGVLR
ncbi:MAG: protease modulator HflC [Pseudomonadota bacterium]